MEESVSRPQTSWTQDALKNGLVLAILHIVLFIFIYYFFPSKLTGLSYVFFVIVFNLAYCFVYAKRWRTAVGGYTDFGKAFLYSFVLLGINGAIQYVFEGLFLLIEPSFPDVLAQSQLDTSLYWAQKFGAPDETLEQMNDKFKPEDIANRFTLTGQFLGFAVSLVFYALGAAIVGLMVRKRQPEVF